MKQFVKNITPAARISLCLFLCLVLLLGGCNTPPVVDDPATTTPTQTTTTTANAGTQSTKILPTKIDRSFSELYKGSNFVPNMKYDPEGNYSRHDYEYTVLYQVLTSDLQSMVVRDLYRIHNSPQWFQEQMNKRGAENLAKESEYPLLYDRSIVDYIELGNFKKDDLVEYFEQTLLTAKQECLDKGEEWTEQKQRAYAPFSYEDIDILCTCDKWQINQQFKSPFAVFARDWKIYPMAWFMDHSVEEWKRAGVYHNDLKEVAAVWEITLGETFLEESGVRQKLDEFFEEDE